MIDENGKYYLYRHIRLDKNEVFYIGISRVYGRAKSKLDRNKYWHNVVKKTAYEWEIIIRSNSVEFIQEKEKEFIKLYGRKDLGEGTLVNLTDGGGDGLNRSKESTLQGMETLKRNGGYEIKLKNLLESNKKISGADNYLAKKVYMYNTEGDFLYMTETQIEIAKLLKLQATKIGDAMAQRKSLKDYLFLPEYVGKKIENLYPYTISPKREKDVWALNPKLMSEGKYFVSTTLAAKSLGIKRKEIYRVVGREKEYAGWIFRRSDHKFNDGYDD